MQRTAPAPWPPKNLPGNWPYTAHRDGWVRWYRGAPRFVCGKRTPLAEVEDRWVEKKNAVDAAAAGKIIRTGAGVTIREAAGLYYEYLDHRVTTGQPEPMSPVTAADYKRTVNAFGRSAGPDRALADVAQPEFTAFAKSFAGQAPSTLARAVAYIQAFVRWCHAEGHLAEVPQWGRYFVKPAMRAHRDVRLSAAKGYTPTELVKLRDNARAEEKAWLGLGLCGALDNSDLAHLTRDVMDRRGGVIDFRRRKVGKVRRVIPVTAEAWKWLDAYRRPEPADPAHADRVFLTPTGLPLQRVKVSRTGREITIDYVAMRWVRLLIRAGLRQAMPNRRRKALRGTPRRRKGEGGGDGRGFRGLRYVLPNAAPPGYRDEVEIVMGHATGTVLLDHYLETIGLARLRELVEHVWRHAFTLPPPQGVSARGKTNRAGAGKSSRRVARKR